MAASIRERGQAYVTGHPFRSAVIFWVLFFIFNIAGGLAGIPLLSQPLLLLTIASVITAAGGLALVAVLGWWKKAGFLSAGTKKDVVFYLLPVIIAFLPVIGGLSVTDPRSIAIFALFAIAVAVAEETFFRGLVLQALTPSGVLSAVLVSSLLFGLPHLLNAVGGVWDPVFTLADTVAAFGVGITFAAIVVRTGTIWPPVILHFLINFVTLLSVGSVFIPAQDPIQLAMTAVAGVVMAGYGLFLIRGREKPAV